MWTRSSCKTCEWPRSREGFRPSPSRTQSKSWVHSKLKGTPKGVLLFLRHRSSSRRAWKSLICSSFCYSYHSPGSTQHILNFASAFPDWFEIPDVEKSMEVGVGAGRRLAVLLHRTGILCGVVAWTEGMPHIASDIFFLSFSPCELPWEHGPVSSSRKANNIGVEGGAREEI